MEYYWISRIVNSSIEYLYSYNKDFPCQSTWGKYLKEQNTDFDAVCEILEVLESCSFQELEFIVYDENDDHFRMAQSILKNNIGVGIYNTTLLKQKNNEYCSLCQYTCKQPSFVFIECCPDFNPI